MSCYKYGFEAELYGTSTLKRTLTIAIRRSALPLSIGDDGSIHPPTREMDDTNENTKNDDNETANIIERYQSLEVRTDGGLSLSECLRTARVLGRILSRAEKKNRAGVNASCGFHVHVGVDTMTVPQLQGVYQNWKRWGEAAILEVLPRSRKDNTYSKSVSDDDDGEDDDGNSRSHDTSFTGWLARGEKYLTLSPHFLRGGVPTLEFRLFAGTLQGYKMVGWLRLIDAFIQYAHTSRSNGSSVLNNKDRNAILATRPALAAFLAERWITRKIGKNPVVRNEDKKIEYKERMISYFKNHFSLPADYPATSKVYDRLVKIMPAPVTTPEPESAGRVVNINEIKQ